MSHKWVWNQSRTSPGPCNSDQRSVVQSQLLTPPAESCRDLLLCGGELHTEHRFLRLGVMLRSQTLGRLGMLELGLWGVRAFPGAYEWRSTFCSQPHLIFPTSLFIFIFFGVISSFLFFSSHPLLLMGNFFRDETLNGISLTVDLPPLPVPFQVSAWSIWHHRCSKSWKDSN